MTTTNIYLIFDGNCEEAFNFYKSVLGGEFQYIGKFKDIPAGDGMPPVKKEDENKIMHVSLPISKETVLMGSDHGGHGPKFTQGNNFSIALNTDTKEEADRIFRGMSAGGNVTMPMNDTFWGSYFGMITDKFGVNWMISKEQKEGK